MNNLLSGKNILSVRKLKMKPGPKGNLLLGEAGYSYTRVLNAEGEINHVTLSLAHNNSTVTYNIHV